MLKLLALVGIVAALNGAAMAQHATELEDGTNSVITLPEDKRGGPVAVMAGAHLEVTLDDQMRIATLGGGALPAVDFDTSGLSRKEETLQAMGKVSMSAAPGAIGYSLMLTADQTNLKVVNNTDIPIAYILALYRGDPLDKDYEYTTTCTVPAGKAVVESWPYLVDGVIIFRVLAPPASDKTMCVDPRKSVKNPEWYPLEME